MERGSGMYALPFSECWTNRLYESQHILQSEGFDDDAGLDETIKKLEADLKKARKKDDDVGDDVVASCSILPGPCYMA